MKPTGDQSELARLQARNRALAAGNAQLEAEAARLRSAHARLQATHREVVQLKEGLEAQLQEALLELAELKRRLFGETSEKLTPEEEAQLAEVAADLAEQAQRDPPASDDVLEDPADSASDPGSAPKSPRRKRPRRHPLPEHLERETVVIEPERLGACTHCGGTPGCIGEEVTEELEYVPAKVVVRRIVRRKYACRCGGGGVQVAPLPPRLLPQSKLGLGLAVYLLLARFDDHVAY
jgi:hypothetical protein